MNHNSDVGWSAGVIGIVILALWLLVHILFRRAAPAAPTRGSHLITGITCLLVALLWAVFCWWACFSAAAGGAPKKFFGAVYMVGGGLLLGLAWGAVQNFWRAFGHPKSIGPENPKDPASPLVWPEHFPPNSRWGTFFMGISALGPDLSFFKRLKQQQAARREEIMTSWSDERERKTAMSLGECLQKQWGWKTPYFIPTDRTMAVIGGPDWWTYFEMDMADVFKEFEEQLGQKMREGFWEAVIDWEDKSTQFGELVRKLTDELKAEVV